MTTTLLVRLVRQHIHLAYSTTNKLNGREIQEVMDSCRDDGVYQSGRAILMTYLETSSGPGRSASTSSGG